MAKAKTPKADKEPEVKQYTLTLRMAAETIVGKGDTPEAALANFPVPTKIVKGGELIFEYDGNKKSIWVTPFQIKTLGYKIKRIFLVRNFKFGLK